MTRKRKIRLVPMIHRNMAPPPNRACPPEGSAIV
jgi:hypothetical protein